MDKEKIEVRDIRESKFLWMERIALEIVSEACGANGISVYTWLCWHADRKTQECYPSISRIADKCKMKRNTVIEVIRTLEGLKVIRATRQPGTKTVYEILDIKPTSTPTDTGIPKDTGTPGAMAPVPEEILPPVSPGIHKQQSSNNNHLTREKQLKPKKPASKELQEALDQVFGCKFNIYQFIAKYRQDCGLIIEIPENVIIAVCKSYMASRSAIKNEWGWFQTVFKSEISKHCASMNIEEAKAYKQDRVCSSVGNILAAMAGNTQRQEELTHA